MIWIPVLALLAAFPAPLAQESLATDELRFWLENMVVHHRYDTEEVAAALEVSPEKAKALVERLGNRVEKKPAPERGLRVLPYPGGRHPRIGFLDGAIDPHRDTKASVFLPWDDAGYVVVDCPEAIWRDGKLIYLAHTHIPTVWDEREIRLERIDWTRGDGGRLTSKRTLPDGFAFEVEVRPRGDVVDLELRLKNGSETKATGLRAQICVLLRGAPEFAAQKKENKLVDERTIAVSSADGKRWMVTTWQEGRPWQNPPCPCVHSDPVFPDLAPGETSTRRGRIFFHEGENVREEIARRRAMGTLDAASPGDAASPEDAAPSEKRAVGSRRRDQESPDP